MIEECIDGRLEDPQLASKLISRAVTSLQVHGQPIHVLLPGCPARSRKRARKNALVQAQLEEPAIIRYGSCAGCVRCKVSTACVRKFVLTPRNTAN